MKAIKLQNCKATLESLLYKPLSFIDMGNKTREIKQLSYEHIESNISDQRWDCWLYHHLYISWVNICHFQSSYHWRPFLIVWILMRSKTLPPTLELAVPLIVHMWTFYHKSTNWVLCFETKSIEVKMHHRGRSRFQH